MATKQRREIDAEKYGELVEKRTRELIHEFDDYYNDALFVSTIEAFFRFAFETPTSDGYKLIGFDRTPLVQGYTPDFVADFENGYTLIGEHKRSFYADNPESCMKQLEKYSLVRNDAGELCDVLFCVHHPDDEKAVTAISNAKLNWTNERGNVVVVDYTFDYRSDNSYLQLGYRSFFHHNESFRPENTAQVGGRQNLNTFIVERTRHNMPIKSEAMIAIERYPFTNDPRPGMYVLIKFIVPLVVMSMSESERDEFNNKGKCDVVVKVGELLARAKVNQCPGEDSRILAVISEGIRFGQLCGVIRRRALTDDFNLRLDSGKVSSELKHYVARRAALANVRSTHVIREESNPRPAPQGSLFEDES